MSKFKKFHNEPTQPKSILPLRPRWMMNHGLIDFRLGGLSDKHHNACINRQGDQHIDRYIS